MKKLCTLFFTLLLIDAAHAQQTFMRIYNTNGHKFQKGYFIRATDSSVFIYRKEGIVEVPATRIGYIKTKRSVVHSVLVVALAGAVPISVLGTAPGKPLPHNDNLYTATKDTLLFTPASAVTTGSITNIPAGGLPAANTRRTTFTINGNIDTWRLQKKKIELLARK